MENTLKEDGRKRQRSSSPTKEKHAKRTFIGRTSEDAIIISDDESGSSGSIRNEVTSKTFHSKCDSPYCQGVLHTSNLDGEKVQECHICLDDEENREVALLNECNHIFCASCITAFQKNGRSWRSDKVHQCPLCRTHSNCAIYTTKVFAGKTKEKLFRKHLNCYQNDPYLREILGAISPLWRDFISTLFRKHMDFELPLVTGINGKGKIIYYGSKYITYRFNNEDVLRTIIFRTFRNASIQILISKEQLCYDNSFDNDYADKVVEWLNLQVNSSPDKLRASLNPSHWHYYMLRKFESFYCVLTVFRIVEYKLPLSSDGITINQLKELKQHNLLEYNGTIKNHKDILKKDGFLYHLSPQLDPSDVDIILDYA